MIKPGDWVNAAPLKGPLKVVTVHDYGVTFASGATANLADCSLHWRPLFKEGDRVSGEAFYGPTWSKCTITEDLVSEGSSHGYFLRNLDGDLGFTLENQLVAVDMWWYNGTPCKHHAYVQDGAYSVISSDAHETPFVVPTSELVNDPYKNVSREHRALMQIRDQLDLDIHPDYLIDIIKKIVKEGLNETD